MSPKRKQSVLTCLVTRSVEDNASFAKDLARKKWQVLSWPSYTYQALPLNRKNTAAMQKISAFDWVVFTSARAVDAFFVVYFEMHRDLTPLKLVKFAAVGARTAAQLKSYGVRVNLVPKINSVAGFVQAKPFQEDRGLKIFYPCARDARDDFVHAFHKKHHIVAARLYRKKPIQHSLKDRVALLQMKVDWVLFYSPSSIDCFLRSLGRIRAQKWLATTQIATIGQTTAAHLQKLKLQARVIADRAETTRLIQQIEFSQVERQNSKTTLSSSILR